MSLIAEYAITPDVFAEDSYALRELGEAHLQRLKETMLVDGIVRDLRDGEWLDVFKDTGRVWHPHSKELLKKLVTQNRLKSYNPVLSSTPVDDCGWCAEALAEPDPQTLSGVIATESVKSNYEADSRVSLVSKLQNSVWWAGRGESVLLLQNLTEYQKHLDLVLQQANSLMFIDAYIDPSETRYRDFTRLLLSVAGRNPQPLIEIHRVAWYGSSSDKRPQSATLEGIFNRTLSAPLKAAGLTVDVFLWPDFHDRYLISDIIGINVPNGFDTTTSPKAVTTWTRLKREDRDYWQREFDPAKNAPSHRFQLP